MLKLDYTGHFKFRGRDQEQFNMAETPTGAGARKLILSATPPNTVKASKDKKGGNEGGETSPKVIQDIKKQMVELKPSSENNKDGKAGSDPVGSGHGGQQPDMADQNKNIDDPVNKKAISSNPEVVNVHP